MAYIRGTSFSERINGTFENDTIEGLEGNDRLYGFEGNDELFGGAGDDDLYGGSGFNNLNGGSGDDFFIMAGRSAARASDNFIEDFNQDSGEEDAIDLSAWGVSDFSQIKAVLSTNRDGNALISANFGGRANTIEIDGLSVRDLGSSDFIYSSSGASEIGGTRFGDTLFGTRSADLIEGGSGADRLLGGRGNDNIYGDGGNDVIFGGTGMDTMTGGSGRDKFVFASASESTSSKADRITDFDLGYDKIDLSLIDAIPRSSTNNAFEFIGRDSFEAVGEVRYSYSGRTTVVSANLDTDSAAEFKVVLNGRMALNEDDFFL